MSTIDEDARLVAFIDGELDEGARAELEARLAIDPVLHERLARLQEGGRPFAAAFDALLDDAPVQRLEAVLASYLQREDRRPTSIRASLRLQGGRLGVAAAVILFCAGIVIGHYGQSWPSRSPDIVTPTGDQDDDWRQAVAEYMPLYTPDTFATAPESQERELPRWELRSAYP